MENNLVIEIKDLWFSYNGNTVLKDVNLTVHAKDFIAIIGPNGGGKTTLMKLIIGILRPDRGLVSVFGHSPHEVSTRIGYIPQDIQAHKTFPISVLPVVLTGRMQGGGGWRRFSKEDKKAAHEALERVEMWENRNRMMTELSGGQRQRIFLARALVDEPELLLLDEPTANLDQKVHAEFYEFLRELNKSVTIVVVSHDLMVLSSYIKSVACVSRQLFFHDAPEITKDMLEKAYQCPVDLIAHGVPHRVFHTHEKE